MNRAPLDAKRHFRYNSRVMVAGQQGFSFLKTGISGSLAIALVFSSMQTFAQAQFPAPIASSGGAGFQEFDSTSANEIEAPTEAPEVIWAALNAAYTDAFAATDISIKDEWTAQYLKFMKVSVQPQSQIAFFRASGFYAFLLYPELQYQEVVSKVYALAAAEGLSIDPTAFQSMEQVSAPEECLPFTLMTAEAILGPLRKTEQKYKTCFVHAGVRAADYLNYSTGNVQPRTSILSTILAMLAQTSTSKNTLNLNVGGYQEYTVGYLMGMGGCAETPWDRLAGQASEEKLEELERSIHELNESADALASPDSNATELLRTWSPTTKELVAEAMKKELSQMGTSLRLGQFSEMTEAAQRLQQIARVFTSAGQKLYAEKFNGFAEFVYRTSFCQGPKVQYSPATFKMLLMLSEGQSPTTEDQLSGLIGEHWASNNPQPLMTSFYADVSQDMKSENKQLPHSALIVGQKYDRVSKQCQYQVLDSNSSAEIDSRLEKDEATNSYWLPLHLLNKNIFLMTTLLPASE